MSDTRAILTRITDLRRRLAQAQGLLQEAGSVASAAQAAKSGTNLTEKLERDIASGNRVQQLLDGSLRQIAGALKGDDLVRPTQLTARAKKLLERGRELIGQLRELSSDPALPSTDTDDPLVRGMRRAAAITESAVRLIQAFPESAGAQLRLCEGVEGVLGSAANRIGVLKLAVARRKCDMERIATLSHLLVSLHGGSSMTLDPFTALAESLLANAKHADPISFLDAGPVRADDVGWMARHVAAHALTVAQIVARLIRHDPELGRHPVSPVIAALLHDIGLLNVPRDILTAPGALDDAQRRTLERHARTGAELVSRQLPHSTGLAEAISGHHERIDGTGYPAGLKGGQIPPVARMLAVVNVYAAMCCPRPHRPAFDPRTALTDTLMLAERGALDSVWAERLLFLSLYPVGSIVELTDGSVARVIASHPPRTDLHTPARPVVAVLNTSRGHWLPTPEFVDLAACEGRAIVRTLTAAQRRQLLSDHYPEWA